MNVKQPDAGHPPQVSAGERNRPRRHRHGDHGDVNAGVGRQAPCASRNRGRRAADTGLRTYAAAGREDQQADAGEQVEEESWPPGAEPQHRLGHERAAGEARPDDQSGLRSAAQRGHERGTGGDAEEREEPRQGGLLAGDPSAVASGAATHAAAAIGITARASTPVLGEDARRRPLASSKVATSTALPLGRATR